jgi:hypothetical protein
MEMQIYFTRGEEGTSDEDGYVAYDVGTQSERIWICEDGVRDTFDLPDDIIEKFKLTLSSERTPDAIEISREDSEHIMVTDNPDRLSTKRSVTMSGTVPEFLETYGIYRCFVTLEYGS